MTENEARLRDALAFILSEQNITGQDARDIAHTVLRDLYGNEIAGTNLQECDAWMAEEIKRMKADLLAGVREEMRKQAG